jgi:hypothetical protein
VSAIYAFVVGIDQYRQNGWSISGPCANALAIVEWLRGIDVPAGNIALFVQPKDNTLDAAIDARRAEGVNVVRDCSSQSIDDFWRLTLRTNKPPGSRLFVFWSGHGFARNDTRRVFVCSDYTAEDFTNRLFNGNLFLGYLRSPAYRAFSEQIFLADVCAKPPKVRLDDAGLAPDPATPLPSQIAYFATPYGQYALGNSGRGVFTDVLLQVLRRFPGWPARQELTNAMREAFADETQKPYSVEGLDARGDILDSVVGGGNELFAELMRLLKPLFVGDEVFRPHFERTLSQLGRPDLGGAKTLPTMLRALSTLQVETPGDLPRGVLQFLLRLQDPAPLRDAITAWLEERAPNQKQDIASVTDELARERDRKLLFVDVTSDAQGDVESYQLYIRDQYLKPVPDTQDGRDVVYPPRKVKGWDEFCARLRQDLDAIRARPDVAELEVHFAVETVLFDRKFHDIELSNSNPLGIEHTVVVRNRQRMWSSASSVQKRWQYYADRLRGKDPKTVKLIPVTPSQEKLGDVLADYGFCYTEFPLARMNTGAASCIIEKKLLQQLLNGGVPYLFWPHAPARAQAAGAPFLKWLQETPSLSEFPATIADKRGKQDPDALAGTLLWDDPERNPFSRKKSG